MRIVLLFYKSELKSSAPPWYLGYTWASPVKCTRQIYASVMSNGKKEFWVQFYLAGGESTWSINVGGNKLYSLKVYINYKCTLILKVQNVKKLAFLEQTKCNNVHYYYEYLIVLILPWNWFWFVKETCQCQSVFSRLLCGEFSPRPLVSSLNYVKLCIPLFVQKKALSL